MTTFVCVVCGTDRAHYMLKYEAGHPDLGICNIHSDEYLSHIKWYDEKPDPNVPGIVIRYTYPQYGTNQHDEEPRT